jgi:hypothetical protein
LPQPAERTATAPPPPLTTEDREAIGEALLERAAIMEFDGGAPRAVAEANARASMRVYRILVSMGPGMPDKWATVLAPGVEPPEALRIVQGQFGPERVLELVEQERRPTEQESGPKLCR